MSYFLTYIKELITYILQSIGLFFFGNTLLIKKSLQIMKYLRNDICNPPYKKINL